MLELKESYSIVIVTHNMQQAAPRLRHDRVLDRRARRRREAPHGPGGRVRRDREDLHEPERPANRGLRDRQGRLMAREREPRPLPRGARSRSRSSALDGLDLVVAALDRTVEAVQHQDIELAELVIADDDVIDGRYLEVHQAILTLLATQAPVATDLRLIAALLHVMKNIERMGDQCVNIAKLIPIAGHEPPADERMLENIVTMGKQVARPDPAGEARLRGSQRRDGARPGPPGRRGRQPQQGVLPARDRDRRRRRPPRVGDDDDPRRPGARADRRQRGRHRRAGRVRGHRALPGVRGRLASRQSSPRRRAAPAP